METCHIYQWMDITKEGTSQLHVMVHIFDVAHVYFYHVLLFCFILHAHGCIVIIKCKEGLALWLWCQEGHHQESV
jgi:hypothetical protein